MLSNNCRGGDRMEKSKRSRFWLSLKRKLARRPKEGLSNSGVSPVIATVIIVAIAITVSVGVGLWVLGITTAFTKFERLELTTAYESDIGQITVIVRNVGSADATVTDIFVNGKPTDVLGINVSYSLTGDEPFTLMTEPLTIKAGSEVTFRLDGFSSTNFVAGQTVEIVFHTAAGRDYPRSVIIQNLQ